MKKYNLIELKENVKHGDYILPFIVYEGDICDDYPYIAIHWHEEFEFTIIRSGSANFKIDLNSYNVEEGDIIFIKSHVLHSINQLPSTNMQWSTMVFNINMLNSASTDGCLLKYLAPIINNIHELPLIIKKDCLGYSEILTTMNNIFNCYNEKSIAYELELKSLLFKLFSLFYKYNLVKKCDERKVIASNTTDKLKTILNYINEHYNENISIKDLSSICDYSEYHFMRFFKKYIGMSCIQYINNLRLDNASKLLTTTNKTIMEISLDVGFENLSYFNKLFKRKYNMTPKAFRLER